MNIINAQTVYETLIGEYEEQFTVPGVENAFAEGSHCERLYQQVYEANQRLCERLGKTDEDPDVELIVGNLLEITQVLCLEMYRYGQQFRPGKAG